MSTTVEAVYEQGVLRLKEPIALPEGTIVEVIIISQDAPQGEAKPSDILTAIASLPLEGNGAEFSGRDHDQILYGKEAPQ